MKNRMFVAGVSIAVISFMLGQVVAQDAPAQPEWTKQTKHHKELAASVGEWHVDGVMHEMGGMKFTATATRTVALGGNYMREVFKGSFGGMPYEGNLLQGYDTIRERYFSVWVDTWGPVPSISYGKSENGVMTMHGEDPDQTGKLNKTRQVIKHKEDGGVFMEFYQVGTGEGGKDKLTMTLDYKRKQAK